MPQRLMMMVPVHKSQAVSIAMTVKMMGIVAVVIIIMMMDLPRIEGLLPSPTSKSFSSQQHLGRSKPYHPIHTVTFPRNQLLRPLSGATVERERESTTTTTGEDKAPARDRTADGEEQDGDGEVKEERQERREESRMHKFYTLPRTAYRIYTSYAKKLWKDTNTSARKKIANDKVKTTIRETQQILMSEYADYSDVSNEARKRLLVACNDMLASLPNDPDSHDDDGGDDDKAHVPVVTSATMTGEAKNHNMVEGTDNNLSKPIDTLESAVSSTSSSSSSTAVALLPVTDSGMAITSTTDSDGTTATTEGTPTTKKKSRSVLFGAVMGAVVACWVFSGNYIFTGVFCLITILGQLEYYRMVMNTGVFPARRISVVGATSMFVTALFAPNLHQICLPMAGLYAMVWKLTMRRQIATIPEIATTFTGMFYLGYVPSFWVRTRLISDSAMVPTRLYPFTSALRNMLFQRFGFLLPQSFIHLPFTSGAIFIFWSWLSLAFSDVGAYFVGRRYGKTKLGTISPAAGATSPNKSVEGVVGGCITSAILSVLGAWVQQWPYFVLTGAVHGILLGLLGLIGDLTASMLKRDAGLKDFGDLIPEHGGILDRVDSFVWTAPYSWLVCAYVIPALKAAAVKVP